MLINNQTLRLQKIFHQNNADIRFVGGCVRDYLLHRPCNDIDFATNATPQQMVSWQLPDNWSTIPTGLQHGTVTFCYQQEDKSYTYEVTTLRGDTNCDGRHATVEFTSDWAADAERRDFTINALYMDFSGVVYDYFNGLGDLQHKRLGFVGGTKRRLKEDFLRAYRYFRFLAVLGFKPKSTFDFKYIADIAQQTEALSQERKLAEFCKGLTSNNPGRFIDNLAKWKLLDFYIPEISALKSCPENVKYHPEGNALAHTTLALNACVDLKIDRIEQRFAIAVHDLGKNCALPEHKARGFYPGHEHDSVLIIEQLAERLKLPNSISTFAILFAENHMKFWAVKNMRIPKVYDFVRRLTSNFRVPENIDLIGQCCIIDKIGRLTDDLTKNNDLKEGQEIISILKGFYQICIKYNFSDIADRDQIIPAERSIRLREFRISKVKQFCKD